MSSPTKRSLQILREDGWLCAIVEKWNPAVKRRLDLFGFIDILALKGDMTLAVQATDASNVSHRVEKIREATAKIARGDVVVEVLALPLLLAARWRVEVHGWARPTKTLRRWRQRIVVVGAGDVSERRVWRQAVRTKVVREQGALFGEDAA